MVAAIREDRTPNLLLMRYALATWEVRDLLLIPSFMFSESAVIKRPPLAATARRAGWVGCNFALNRIPGSARIPVVSEGAVLLPAEVREQYHLARKQVEGLTVKQRGCVVSALCAESGRRQTESGQRPDATTEISTRMRKWRSLISMISRSARRAAISTWCKSSSIPTQPRLSRRLATAVVPLPRNGSSTRSPSFVEANRQRAGVLNRQSTITPILQHSIFTHASPCHGACSSSLTSSFGCERSTVWSPSMMSTVQPRALARS